MAQFSIRMEGGDKLAQRLKALPESVSKPVVRSALKEGAEPIRLAAQQHAPKSSEAPHLSLNIGVSVASRIGSVDGGRWRAAEDGEQAVAIGPTKEFFYGLFQEYGTSPHRQPKRRVNHPGHAAQPFMRPAFDGQSRNALGIIGRALWAALSQRVGAGSGNSGAGTGGRFL